MSLLAIILYRYFMIKRKMEIYEWYQLNRPLWLSGCSVCLFYNLAFIECGLWALFIYELVRYLD